MTIGVPSATPAQRAALGQRRRRRTMPLLQLRGLPSDQSAAPLEPQSRVGRIDREEARTPAMRSTERQACRPLRPRHLHPRRGMRARPPIRFQSIEEAVDRRKQRVRGGGHRTGHALPLGGADLSTARRGEIDRRAGDIAVVLCAHSLTAAYRWRTYGPRGLPS